MYYFAIWAWDTSTSQWSFFGYVPGPAGTDQTVRALNGFEHTINQMSTVWYYSFPTSYYVSPGVWNDWYKVMVYGPGGAGAWDYGWYYTAIDSKFVSYALKWFFGDNAGMVRSSDQNGYGYLAMTQGIHSSSDMPSKVA